MILKYLFILEIFLTAPANAANFDFSHAKHSEVEFSDIAKTDYSIEKNKIKIKVDNSSSALIYPFEKVQEIKSLSFRWATMGNLNVKNIKHLRTKSGDDAFLRVGLILEGEAPSIPFFAPAWIKKISKILNLPSDSTYYLSITNVGSKGYVWESPYTSSIKSEVVGVSAQKHRESLSQIKFTTPKKVVGLWIQADGDNTHSQFSSEIKDLVLE